VIKRSVGGAGVIIGVYPNSITIIKLSAVILMWKISCRVAQEAVCKEELNAENTERQIA